MFFIGSLSWGGAEKVITLLAHSFLDKGYEVYIVSVLSNKKVYDLDSRIHLISLARENKSYLKNTFYWIKSIKNTINSIKPNIVVSFVCRINLLVILGVKKSKHNCRLVISERNDPRYDTRGKLARFMSKRLYPKADLLICQTNQELNYFTDKIKKKSVVIPNPVFLTAKPTTFSQKKKIIINAARYDESKNQKLLIDSFAKLINNKSSNDYELHFYGSGGLKAELVNCINGKKINDKVKIFDSIKNVQDKISEASIFCLSSNYEGFSNSLMEALLLGTPSISTDTSGAKDLIDEGKNGYVVPLGNVDELANKLSFLINNDNVREYMYNYSLSGGYQKRFVNSLDSYIKNIEG